MYFPVTNDSTPVAGQNVTGLACDYSGLKVLASSNWGPSCISLNGGATWDTYGDDAQWDGALASSDFSRIYLHRKFGKLWVSTDEGQTYAELEADTDTVANTMCCSEDGQHIYGVGNTSFRRSNDGGITWAAPVAMSMYGVGCDPTGKHVYRVSYEFRMQVSNDYGDTWENIPTGYGRFDAGPIAVAPDGLIAYEGHTAGGMFPNILRTLDGGATWPVIDTGTTAFGVACTPYTGKNAVFCIPSSYVRITTDFGETMALTGFGGLATWGFSALSASGQRLVVSLGPVVRRSYDPTIPEDVAPGLSGFPPRFW